MGCRLHSRFNREEIATANPAPRRTPTVHRRANPFRMATELPRPRLRPATTLLLRRSLADPSLYLYPSLSARDPSFCHRSLPITVLLPSRSQFTTGLLPRRSLSTSLLLLSPTGPPRSPLRPDLSPRSVLLLPSTSPSLPMLHPSLPTTSSLLSRSTSRSPGPW